MKKELNKANKQLTLGKMTVAKMPHSQVKNIAGGNATTKPQKPNFSKLFNGDPDPDCTIAQTFEQF